MRIIDTWAIRWVSCTQNSERQDVKAGLLSLSAFYFLFAVCLLTIKRSELELRVGFVQKYKMNYHYHYIPQQLICYHGTIVR